MLAVVADAGIEGPVEWLGIAANATACLAAGLLARSVWALALAAIPPLIAAPFGFPDDPELYEPLPLWFWMLLVVSPAYLLLLGVGALAGAGKWKAAILVSAAVAAAIGTYALIRNEEQAADQRSADQLAKKIEAIEAGLHGRPRKVSCKRFPDGALGGSGDDGAFSCEVEGEPGPVRPVEVRVERETGHFEIRARRGHPPADGCCIELG